MDRLSFELVDAVIDNVAPAIHNRKQTKDLAPLAAISRLFHGAVCKRLYKRIFLPPVEDFDDGEEKPEYNAKLGILTSIALNPVLGSYVRVLKCDDPDYYDQDIWDIINEDAELSTSVGFPAIDNMSELQVVRLTPTKLALHFLRTLHSKKASLSELHLVGGDPRVFLWDPIQVASVGSLRHLTSFTWSLAIIPNKTIETISFIVSLLESTAPTLAHLCLNNGSGRDTRHSLGGEPAIDIGSTIAERQKTALNATQPCSLKNLQSLTIDLVVRAEAEHMEFMDWVPRFFGSSLSSSSLRSLEIRTRCLRQQVNRDFIRKLCASAGPSLRNLSLKGCVEYNCPAATPQLSSDGAHIIRSLAQPLQFSGIVGEMPTSFSLCDTLETLKIDQIHGLFDETLAQELSNFHALKTLALGDQLTMFGHEWIDGGWLDLESYHFEVNFICKLPSQIQNVHLTLNAQGCALTYRDRFLGNEGSIFRDHLRSLKQLYITCWLEERNSLDRNPLEEVYIHRLPGADSRSKRLALTHLGMGEQHHVHRAIHSRDFQDIQLSEEDGKFEGVDEVCAWTYDEDERDILAACTNDGDGGCEYEPFALADPESAGVTSNAEMNRSL